MSSCAAHQNQRTLVPREHYTDPAIFAEEQRRLFRKTWQFFCLESDLQRQDDFVTGSVAGEPVVVQHIGGAPRAFHNICSHRFSPIQTACAGRRPLRCPYHGWQYDATGYPAAIPHNLEFYPISPEEKRALSLRGYETASLGGLRFVRVEGGGQSLVESLGDSAAVYEPIAAGFDDVYFHTTIPVRCNWKFLIHNLFDDIHAEFVHPSTSLDTSSYIGGGWTSLPFDPSLENPPFDCSRRHAQFRVQITEEAQRSSLAQYAQWWPTRPWPDPGYFHGYIFPNLLITSYMGLWFNIVRYHPVSPDRTDVTVWVVPARQPAGATRIEPNLLHFLALGSLRIFNEDINAVETSQAGMHALHRPGILGQRENKLAEFESAYMHLMTAAHP